ncbi:PPM-type phosphatase domain-containing protein [Durusdinium trenchii]|uniref:PPM-type phosphatase domain-containing protein n=1 Tax=Durusdinium trenchii TaxID=1381693 RepID=A0ABP0P615_9DINO
MAAECCAKTLLPKLLRNMSAIPQGYENATFVKVHRLLHIEFHWPAGPSIQDGCGGAVALLVGEKLFTAVCGKCELVLIEAGQRRGVKQDPCKAVSMGSHQGSWSIPEDQNLGDGVASKAACLLGHARRKPAPGSTVAAACQRVQHLAASPMALWVAWLLYLSLGEAVENCVLEQDETSELQIGMKPSSLGREVREPPRSVEESSRGSLSNLQATEDDKPADPYQRWREYQREHFPSEASAEAQEELDAGVDEDEDTADEEKDLESLQETEQRMPQASDPENVRFVDRSIHRQIEDGALKRRASENHMMEKGESRRQFVQKQLPGREAGSGPQLPTRRHAKVENGYESQNPSFQAKYRPKKELEDEHQDQFEEYDEEPQSNAINAGWKEYQKSLYDGSNAERDPTLAAQPEHLMWKAYAEAVPQSVTSYLDQETVKARRRRHTSNRRRRSVLAKDLALSGSNIREESPDRFDPQARRHPNLFAQGPPSRSRAETRIEADEEDEEDNDDQETADEEEQLFDVSQLAGYPQDASEPVAAFPSQRTLAVPGLGFHEEGPTNTVREKLAKFDPQARKNPSLFSQEPPSRSRPEKRIEADEEDEVDNDDQESADEEQLFDVSQLDGHPQEAFESTAHVHPQKRGLTKKELEKLQKSELTALEEPPSHPRAKKRKEGDKKGKWKQDGNHDEVAKFLVDNGGMVFPGENGKLMTSNPQGHTTAVSRSIGDRAWKGSMGGLPGSLKLVRSVPETRYTDPPDRCGTEANTEDLSWAERHVALMLTSAPVSQIPTDQASVTIADFEQKPRAASGEIASRAATVPQNGQAQCTTIVAFFVPKDDKLIAEPAAKRMKKEAESVRLRHIVVRHQDCSSPFDPVRNVPVSRSAQEAEAILRQALQELILEAKTIKLPAGKKPSAAAFQPTPKFTSLCKELSECNTAQKGGGMIGDLGWLQPDELKSRFGPAFSEAAKMLNPGQWSHLEGPVFGAGTEVVTRTLGTKGIATRNKLLVAPHITTI